MKIKVSVPATSANVGSGFDALGLAVTLYNTVTFEDSEVLEISASDGTRIPRGESNLVYRSAKGLFSRYPRDLSGSLENFHFSITTLSLTSQNQTAMINISA